MRLPSRARRASEVAARLAAVNVVHELIPDGAGDLDLTRFLMVAAVFGIEHQEWLAGFLAGLAYGWMYVRTRDIWAVSLAHAVTNLLLGFYVIRTGAWQFW